MTTCLLQSGKKHLLGLRVEKKVGKIVDIALNMIVLSFTSMRL